MVAQFGMSDKLGPVAYRTGEEHTFLGKDIYEAREFVIKPAPSWMRKRNDSSARRTSAAA